MTGGRRWAEAMLVLATFFWGWTFPVIKEAIQDIPIFAFLFLRFSLASALMLPLIRLRYRPAALKSGVYLGTLLFCVFAFQTWGLLHTTASKCAFITGLNVIWIAVYFARDRRSWLAVALGVISLWLLTDPTVSPPNRGDFLTLIASLFIALHLIALQNPDSRIPSGELAITQFITVAILSLLCSLSLETSLLPEQWSFEIIFALIITVLGATIFSFWAQTHFQRRTTALRTALIFLMEPLFAALFAIGFYQEAWSLTTVLGAALMLFAMALASVRKR